MIKPNPEEHKQSFSASHIHGNLIISALVGVLLLLAGSTYEVVESHNEHPIAFLEILGAHLLAELGIAFIVGVVVALVIEFKARERLEKEHRERREEIEADIFKHLFGFGLNQGIVQELVTTIFSTKFTREQFSITWQFDQPDKAATAIAGAELKVLVTVSYLLRNTSRSIEKHAIEHYFENGLTLAPELSCFIELKAHSKEHQVTMTREHLATLAKPDGIRLGFKLEKELSIGPDDPLRVSFTYQTHRRRSDSEVWVTTLPTLGLTLEAIVNPTLPALVFQPDSSHRTEPELDDSSEAPGSTIRRWRMESGILPYQGIVMYWH